MKQIVVDTNVLIDYYLERPRGADVLPKLVLERERGEIELVFPLPVILELEWVLRSYYKLDKQFITERIARTLQVASDKEPYSAICVEALELFIKSSQVGFDDCIIAVAARQLGTKDLVTNDRALKKLFKNL